MTTEPVSIDLHFLVTTVKNLELYCQNEIKKKFNKINILKFKIINESPDIGLLYICISNKIKNDINLLNKCFMTIKTVEQVYYLFNYTKFNNDSIKISLQNILNFCQKNILKNNWENSLKLFQNFRKLWKKNLSIPNKYRKKNNNNNNNINNNNNNNKINTNLCYRMSCKRLGKHYFKSMDIERSIGGLPHKMLNLKGTFTFLKLSFSLIL